MRGCIALFERALPSFSATTDIPSIAEIYAFAVETWLRRDSVCARLAIGRAMLREHLADLAGAMFPEGFVRLDQMSMDLRTEQSYCQDWVNALINTDLLQLNRAEELRFSHRSLWEFFFALKVSQQLEVHDATLLARSNLVYGYVINCFLVPLLKSKAPVAAEAAHSLRAALLRRAEAVPGGLLLAEPVRRSEYASFVQGSGWRRTTGYGQWLSLETPDGSTPVSEGILTGVGHTPETLRGESNAPVTGVSWYDAWLFCRWVGAVLPPAYLVPRGEHQRQIDSEWSADWFDESHGLILVVQGSPRREAGVNPDLRARSLGFRAYFPMSPGVSNVAGCGSR
jgi:hypothetical protein